MNISKNEATEKLANLIRQFVENGEVEELSVTIKGMDSEELHNLAKIAGIKEVTVIAKVGE